MAERKQVDTVDDADRLDTPAITAKQMTPAVCIYI